MYYWQNFVCLNFNSFVMIANNYNHNISFEALNYRKINNINVPEIFRAKLTDMPVDCFVKTNREKDVQRVILVDNEDNELGYSKCTQTGSKVFFNNSMYNYSDYKGVGSVMHLTQIISMLENKLDKIELYSVGDAICFHAKFGFKSDIADNDNLLYFINKEILSLRKSDKRFNSIVKNAQNWVSNTNISGKEKIRQGENIINEYIATINRLKLNNEDNFRMLTGINMCLKKETVLNNKEYYNNLFKKFGIDYQIND